MAHVMFDLETMGTRPDAPIVSIGAVWFNADEITHELYVPVDLSDSVASGATMDPETVKWWLSQSDEARKELFGQGAALRPALEVLVGLGSGWGGVLGVWGNGANFDNVILRESYIRLGLKCPWPFWKDRCYRTVKLAFPQVEMKRTGTHHNALDDARSQCEHLMEINKVAGGVFL